MRVSPTRSTRNLIRQNLRLVKQLYPGIPTRSLATLRDLTAAFGISVSLGDILDIEGKWYVTHGGLLRLAQRRHCAGIRVQQVREFCDPLAARWVFKATLYKRRGSYAFVGYGDADPSNVSSIVRGAEMRVAETRAVNRALRKAYGIGICSFEELGVFSNRSAGAPPSNGSGSPSCNGSGNQQPRLRDQLCLLIRQFKLDPNLVKSYAADFCGTEVIGDASRESVESFISHLTTAAKENRDALVCKLNSYAQPVEARS